MTAAETSKTASVFQRWRMLDAFRRRQGSRRALVIVSILVASAVAVIVAFNWGWLVASGIASILLSALPCLGMCGLGLCMHKFSSGARAAAIRSTATEGSADSTPETTGGLVASVVSCCSGAGHCGPAMVPTKGASIQPREKNDA